MKRLLNLRDWVQRNPSSLLSLGIGFGLGIFFCIPLNWHLPESAAAFAGALIGAIATVGAALSAANYSHRGAETIANANREARATAVSSLIFDELNRIRLSLSTTHEVMAFSMEIGAIEVAQTTAREQVFNVPSIIREACDRLDCFGPADAKTVAEGIQAISAASRRLTNVVNWQPREDYGPKEDQLISFLSNATSELGRVVEKLEAAEAVLLKYGATTVVRR